MKGLKFATWAANAVLLCTGLLTLLAANAAEVPAKVALSAYQVSQVNEGGKPRERLQTLEGVRPGDTIEYEAVYQGDPARATRGVRVTVPVPAGLQYRAPAHPAVAGLSASTDGTTFQPVPLMQNVTLANGRIELRPVPAASYRFLRWELGDVPAGASRTVRARMQMPPLTDPNSGSAL